MDPLKPSLANLVYLNDKNLVDGVCFEMDWMEFGEHPLDEHIRALEEKICEELKISDLYSRFIKYAWCGTHENVPWDTRHNIPFDFNLPTLVVPEIYKIHPSIEISGVGRKIILTFPPGYEDGQQPVYFVSCANEGQVEDVRVLNPMIAKPFDGLERIFTKEGYESLPKLKDINNLGVVTVDKELIVVPKSSTEFF